MPVMPMSDSASLTSSSLKGFMMASTFFTGGYPSADLLAIVLQARRQREVDQEYHSLAAGQGSVVGGFTVHGTHLHLY
jgi:hypothetical protein